MSGEAVAVTRTKSARLIQALALVVIAGVLFLGTRVAPDAHGIVGTVSALGFLLLAGTLASELIETIGLPHLSGYLLAGIVAGPHALHLVDHETVERLSTVNPLTIALIALAGGAELRLEAIRSVAKSVAWATVFHSTIVLFASAGAFYWLAKYTPFSTLERTALIGSAALWGVLAVSRSPTVVLGVLAQLKPKGPLTSYSLAFVMLSDVVVVVMMAITIALVRPQLEPGASLSLSDLGVLGHEIIGSVALGTTVGLVLSGYLRLGGNLLVVLFAIGIGMSELVRYIRLDPLLCFLVAGFVVENISAQGEKLLEGIHKTGTVVFVIFFGVAGAQLDLPALAQLWPVALALAATRAFTTFAAARVSSAVAKDPPAVRRWGWSGLVSQAGLTLGLSVVVVRTFPSIGDAFRSLAIAVIAINELIGPILFKLGLDRAGETSKDPEAADAPAQGTEGSGGRT
jgi:Kef-type K+ transport system membrane component KefB